MKIKKIIYSVESKLRDPSKGLPEDVFLFVSRITPIINVDLLIKNKENRTLLTWRDDGFYPAGWHIPGGIIRYKETISDRIRAVAKNELRARVSFEKEPLAINEVMHPSRKTRGHFISFLYACKLISLPDKKLEFGRGELKPGQWHWFSKCPKGIISVHEMYRKFI